MSVRSQRCRIGRSRPPDVCWPAALKATNEYCKPGDNLNLNAYPVDLAIVFVPAPAVPQAGVESGNVHAFNAPKSSAG